MVLKLQPFDLIARNAINEHGDISEHEAQVNLKGMRTLGPIVSRYKVDPTRPRSKTVVILTRAPWDEPPCLLSDHPASAAFHPVALDLFPTNQIGLWGAGRRAKSVRSLGQLRARKRRIRAIHVPTFSAAAQL